jgi:hypothetical protein
MKMDGIALVVLGVASLGCGELMANTAEIAESGAEPETREKAAVAQEPAPAAPESKRAAGPAKEEAPPAKEDIAPAYDFRLAVLEGDGLVGQEKLCDLNQRPHGRDPDSRLLALGIDPAPVRMWDATCRGPTAMMSSQVQIVFDEATAKESFDVKEEQRVRVKVASVDPLVAVYVAQAGKARPAPLGPVHSQLPESFDFRKVRFDAALIGTTRTCGVSRVEAPRWIDAPAAEPASEPEPEPEPSKPRGRRRGPAVSGSLPSIKLPELSRPALTVGMPGRFTTPVHCRIGDVTEAVLVVGDEADARKLLALVPSDTVELKLVAPPADAPARYAWAELESSF